MKERKDILEEVERYDVSYTRLDGTLDGWFEIRV